MTADLHTFDLAEALYGMDTLEDIEDVRERAREGAAQDADNVCIYYTDCMDIIRRYESEVHASDVEDLLAGREPFPASEWREAMTAYANAVAYVALSAAANAAVDALEEALSALQEAAANHGAEEYDAPRISRDCPHGWAVHDKEDEAGVCYWSEAELEGCRAVAIRSSGVWLSFTWTPGAAAAA
jgi:hypothetical protein